MSIDVNVQNDLVIVTESSEDITVNVSNAAGPAGVGVPVGGTTGQVLKKQSGTDYDTFWALDGGGVPYSGATGDVNLGTHRILAQNATIASSGSGDTFTLNHSSGSGIGLNITKGGNGEGLYINKTSGSGNAATIIGTLNATTLVKSGGTSSQFLKADGSVDSTTYVGGSGVSGQVAYWNGTNSQTGSNNLFWDAANSRLGIGTNTPAYGIQIATTTGSFGVRGQNNTFIFEGTNSGTSNTLTFFTRADNTVGIVASNFLQISTSASAQIFGGQQGLNCQTNDGLILIAGSTNAFKIYQASRNVTIQNGGAFSDSGQRLQVQGDAFIKGSGNTSATNALTVQNSGGTELFRIDNQGRTAINGASYNNGSLAVAPISGQVRIALLGGLEIVTSGTPSSSGVGIGVEGSNRTMKIYGVSGASINALDNSRVEFLGTNSWTRTSGIARNILISDSSFAPTSGTSTYFGLEVQATINQTGGANGITRGLYVNPTLTAAADWRSIEWSNNSGWGLYGAGTAPNYLGGTLTASSFIKSGGTSAQILAADGSVITAGTNITISGGTISASGGGGTTIYTGDGTLAGNRVVNLAGFNLAFLNAASTYGMYFSADSNIPRIDFLANGNFIGQISNTSTDVRIANNLVTTGGIIFDTQIISGTTATRMKLTNAGRLLLGTTTESTFLLDVNGNARVNNGLSIRGTTGNTFLIIGNANVASFVHSDYRLFIGGVQVGTENLVIGASNISFGTRGSSIGDCRGYFLADSLGVGLGATAINTSAIGQFESTTRGFLPPRMTNAQRTAISSPAVGLIVYCTDMVEGLYVYKSTGWTFVI